MKIPSATLAEFADLVLATCPGKREPPRLLVLNPKLDLSLTTSIMRRACCVTLSANAYPSPSGSLIADSATLPFRASSLDAVIDFEFLQYASEPEMALREIRRTAHHGALFWVWETGWEPGLPEILREKYCTILHEENGSVLDPHADFAWIHRLLRPDDRVRVHALSSGNWEAIHRLGDLMDRPEAFLPHSAVPREVHAEAMNKLRRWCDSRYPRNYSESAERSLEVREIRLAQ